MAGGVEPGWYPDPHDSTQARYWSGADWSDRTRPLDTPAATPATRQAPPWPVLALGAVGAVALGVMVAVLLTRGDDGSTQELEVAASPSGPTPTNAPTTTTQRPTTTTTVVGVTSLDQWIAVLASVEQSAGSAEADARHGAIQARFSEAEQLDSSEFESLRPGYLITFVGPFATPEATIAFCQSNGLSVPQECYGRFLSHDPQDATLIADS